MSGKRTAKNQGDASTDGFSEQERAAIKARAAEVKAEKGRRSRSDKAAADRDAVVAKIAEMPADDRALAERVHELVTTAAPDLAPKLYYGQPAYARKGKVVCFFRSGQMDGERYSTFGFSQEANLDDPSGLWPTSYALTTLTKAGEKTITEMVKTAIS